ncbi:hypothetical protein KI387_029553, partial [Taxus chinensis]
MIPLKLKTILKISELLCRSPSQAQKLPPAVKNDRKMLNGNGQSQGRTGRQLPSTGGKSKLEPRNCA